MPRCHYEQEGTPKDNGCTMLEIHRKAPRSLAAATIDARARPRAPLVS
jgi:hypothetical protein